MSFSSINTNIPSLRAQRFVQTVNETSQKNLERLSSGLKINRAADGPAAMVASEKMRGQISSLNQAIENSEISISLTQTTEGALTEINRVLSNMRQLAVHASNVGVNDEQMLAADQAELENSLKMIERVAKDTQFGTKALLDGSKGGNGVATGENLQFVSAEDRTKDSPAQGYSVKVTRAASQASRVGSAELTQEMINAGEIITLDEGGRTVELKTDESMTFETVYNELQSRIEQGGLNLEVFRAGEGNRLAVRHRDYGSEAKFTASSSSAGVLSAGANVPFHVNNGRDVVGEINGEEAIGTGQLLQGREDNANTAGLTVRYTGELAPAGGIAGKVVISQNSLTFQIGANQQSATLSLRDMKPTALATGMNNASDYKSLADLNLTTFQGSQDAIRLIDKAIQETSMFRAHIGAFQTNTLESNLNYLRVASENMTASESVIRDADFAKEMADFTRNQILQQSAMSMLAQANQQPLSVMSLLN